MSDLTGGVLGDGQIVRINGKEYPIKPMTLGDFKAATERVKTTRRAYLNELSKNVDEPEARAELVTTYGKPVRDEDVFDYLTTIEGAAYLIWLSVSRAKDHGYKSFDDFVNSLSFDELMSLQKKTVEETAEGNAETAGQS